MSDFASVPESGVVFSATELDTGVDFSSDLDVGSIFSSTELDSGVDFTPTGDLGHIILTTQVGFGEGGFGEGGFGGDISSVVINQQSTIWTNIETP